MTSEYYILHYAAIHMDKNWQLGPQTAGDIQDQSYHTYVTAVNHATLQVLVEAPQGAVTTYTFTVSVPAARPGQPVNSFGIVVWVRERIVRIPTNCSTKTKGDQIG